MASLNHEDVMRMFPRISAIVDLKGAYSASEITKRLVVAINAYPPRLSRGYIELIKRVIPFFGAYVIDEARANPRGEVALTLKYGRKTAKLIVEAQARQYLAYLRKKAKQKKSRSRK